MSDVRPTDYAAASVSAVMFGTVAASAQPDMRRLFGEQMIGGEWRGLGYDTPAGKVIVNDEPMLTIPQPVDLRGISTPPGWFVVRCEWSAGMPEPLTWIDPIIELHWTRQGHWVPCAVIARQLVPVGANYISADGRHRLKSHVGHVSDALIAPAVEQQLRAEMLAELAALTTT